MTLTLASTETILGGAAAASVITYTIFGDEITSGPINAFKVLAQGQLSAVSATLYTAPASPAAMTIVKTMVFANTDSVARAVGVYVNGSTAPHVIGSFTIPAGGEANWSSSGWNMRDANGASVTTSTIVLTGDVTGSGSGSVATTLATVATAGTTGDASHVAQVVLDAKGRTLTAAAVPIQIATSQVTGFDTQVRTSRLDQMAAPTATVSAGSQVISNAASPVNPSDVANKAYVDAAAAGLKVKPSVNSANAAGNIVIAGVQTTDGVTSTANVTRTLLTAQTLPVQNGIWVQQTGAWTRPTDFATGSEASGSFVFVDGGTLNAASGWVVTGEPPVTVDTTAQTWTQFSGAGEILPGNSMTKSGNTLNVTTSPAAATAVGTTRTLTAGTGIATIGDLSADRTIALAAAAAGTLLANNTGGSAAPTPVSVAAAKTLLAIANTDVSGLGTLATQSGTFSGTHSGSSSGTNTGDQTITLTGDVTGSGTGSFAATLAAAGTAGTYGDATHVPQIVTDSKGRVTGVTAVAITGVGGNNFGVVTGNTGTANSDVTGDTIAITGSGSVSTTATDAPDGLVITNAAATRTAAGNMSATDYNRVRKEWDAYADFGLVGDLRSVEELPATGTQVVMTSGSNVVNIPNSGATTPFTSTAVDGGKRITIEGAGASGAMLVGFIGAVNTSTQCTVLATVGGSALNASTTVTANATGPVTVHVQWGTDNTTAIGTMTAAINAQVYGCPKITFGGNETADWTNAWGIPVPIVFTKTVWLEGIGSWHTTDIGDYTKTGSTRLAWWGTSSDGGTAFGAMITIAPTGAQALKRPRLSELFLDGRNGNQNQALWLLKWTSCHGASLDNVGFMDALAGAMWTDVATSPTEAADFTRFSFTGLCFRQLDDSLLAPPTTTPTALLTAASNFSTTPQTITITSGTGFSAGGGYFWTQSQAGKVYLARYTGASGGTLSGVTIAVEDTSESVVPVNPLFVVPCTPSKGMAWKLNGNASHNTCCGSIRDVQVSYGGTWGPAAFEVYNSDTVAWDMIQMNGGSNVTETSGNRQRRPGVRLNGSNSSGTLASRNHTFRNIDPGGSPGGPLGGISVMGVTNAGALLVAPSGPHYVDLQDMGNGAPLPIVELGASLLWNGNGMFHEGGLNALTANQALTAAVANVVNGCWTVVPPQGWQAGTRLKWDVRLAKTAVGTAWTLNVRQHSSLTAGGGTLIATAVFTAAATIDDGWVVVDLVCTSIATPSAAVALARYLIGHNVPGGTTAGTNGGLASGTVSPVTSPSPATAALGSFEGPMTMATFNSAAPGSGPTFLFLEIVPTTASTVMTVLAPSGLICLKDANP